MTASQPPELDLETVYELLAHPYREHLLRSLAPGERRSVDDIVDVIVTRERSGPTETVDPSARRRIRIELVHDHLPRLDHHGVVDYAHESKEVVLTAPIDRDEVDGDEPGSLGGTGDVDESAAAAAILERMIDA
ncbi:DUF7344 domain-containing protein [Halopiger xanaduensis]|uniref:DUF7344 domain-containing protein n=1 Tax=Halopiger xanaduensis (strain DSM 18323 / JCM 14033 / SH-6) TaxID=797210 RepID=F8D8L5_HALXS|nr:hypothetical protein [Halopiger xanaduensis]AEH36767.1 hypothetical protein Halxa_2142 [Halopiger xanaduensis SH-6]